MPNPTLNILILCPGGVGLGLAVILANTGNNVQLIGRNGSLPSAGLTLRDVRTTAVFDRSDDFVPAHAIITTKAYDLKPVIARHHGILEQCRSALVLQNGLGILESVSALKNVVQGVLYVSAERRNTSEALWWKPMRLVLDGGDWRSAEIGGILQLAGIRIERDKQFMEVVFRKLIMNVALNPVSTLYRLSNKEFLEHPVALARAFRAGNEVKRIGEAMGLSINEFPEEIVVNTLRGVPDFRSSMLQDKETGRPLELESILEEPLRLAARYGIQTPEIAQLLEELKRV